MDSSDQPKKKFSIIGLVYKLRGQLAIILGLCGISLLLISFAVPEPYKSSSAFEFIGRLGEVLATTGFLAYIIEHHTISEFVTKDISVSIIKDLFRYYFNKEEMRKLIVEFTRELNQYEDLDDDIWKLYERHGIVELMTEPVREDLHIAYKYLGPVDGAKNSISLNKHWSFRAKNTAKKISQEDLSKRINRNGLVQGATILVDASFPTAPNEVQAYVQKETNLLFFINIPTANGKMKRKELKPLYFYEKDFNRDEGIPNTEPKDSDNLFLVFGIDSTTRTDGRKYLNIELYLNEMIQPGDSLGIEFNYNVVVDDFNVSTFDFVSYTHGFCISLDFDDELFKTDIGDRIIGSGFKSNKTDKGFTYSGWIIPHSSVAFAWVRKPLK